LDVDVSGGRRVTDPYIRVSSWSPPVGRNDATPVAFLRSCRVNEADEVRPPADPPRYLGSYIQLLHGYA